MLALDAGNVRRRQAVLDLGDLGSGTGDQGCVIVAQAQQHRVGGEDRHRVRQRGMRHVAGDSVSNGDQCHDKAQRRPFMQLHVKSPRGKTGA
jgi:hypothetical protein